MRVGIVSYINALPFTIPLSRYYTLTLETPATLNRLFRDKQLDVILSSSIGCLHSQKPAISGFGIGANGKILSVNLYTPLPPQELDGKPIALDPSSETSNFLLRILCKELWKVAPLFVTNADDHLAKLVIGDQALLQHHNAGQLTIDLATAWEELTSLPFVFARFIHQEGVDTTLFEERLEEALTWSENHLDEITRSALEKIDLPSKLIELYYQTCIYRLGEQQMKGFNRFEHYVTSYESQSHVCSHC